MKATNQPQFIRGTDGEPSFLRRCAAAVLCLSLPILPAVAQSVLSSPPQTPATPTAVQDQQNSNPMQVFAPLETFALPLPLQWGPFSVHPHVDYQFSYGNGIQSSPGRQQDTIVQQLSPGVLFNLGDHWTLDYTPTLSFYSSSNLQNTVNHSVQLGWGTAYRDWFFSGSQGFNSSSDPNIETASQTDRQSYSTALNASYQFNDKMSLDAGLSQNFNYVGNGTGSTNDNLQNLSLANSKSWSTMEWFNYQFWSRLNAGIGAGAGYTIQENSPDSVNEQYQARINWRAMDKISFQLSGGLEDRQYLSGGAGDLLYPIFGATVQYQPFDQTRISLSASRSVSASYFQNQTSERTGVHAGLNQRLLGMLNLDLSGGYASSKYQSSVSGPPGAAGRNDDIYSFGARLSCPLLKRGSVSVFYAYSKNSSSQSGFTSGPGFGYTSTQVGFDIGWRY